jgi:hypothetical protein
MTGVFGAAAAVAAAIKSFLRAGTRGSAQRPSG